MAVTEQNLPSPSQERPIGFGRLKRKEDARFIRGKGTYLDDIRLPGMVHGALLVWAGEVLGDGHQLFSPVRVGAPGDRVSASCSAAQRTAATMFL